MVWRCLERCASPEHADPSSHRCGGEPDLVFTYGAGDVNSIQVGDNTNIQDGATVHVARHNPQGHVAPTVIGSNVTIGAHAIRMLRAGGVSLYGCRSKTCHVEALRCR